MISKTRRAKPFERFFILPPDSDVEPDVAQNFRHNVLVNGVDAIAWLFGDSFLSASTILPVFASRLTNSPLVIGLIPALLNTGWFLPQLFMAPLVARQPRKLPMVAWLSAIERLPFLGLALLALGLERLSPQAAVGIFIALIVWRAFSSGLVALPWQELIATVIPLSHRGRYFGYSHLLGELAGMGGAALAAYLLASLPHPHSYALVFSIGCLSVGVSYVFLLMTVEPRGAPPARPSGEHGLSLRQAGAILRENANFRNFLLSRATTYMGGMASGFLAVYGVQRFNLPDAQAAIFMAVLLAGSMVGFALSGWIGDRMGYKLALEGAGILWVAALLVGLLAPSVIVFYAVFALVGISNGSGVIADLNIVMEFGPVAERPLYIGLARTVMGPVLFLAPLVGGRITQVASYPLMFSVSLAFAVVGLGLLWLRVVDPREYEGKNSSKNSAEQ